MELFPGAQLEALEYGNLADWTRPLAQLYRVRIEQYATAHGGRLFVPLALYPEHANTLTGLLRAADAAMYRAKARCRGVSNIGDTDLLEKAVSA